MGDDLTPDEMIDVLGEMAKARLMASLNECYSPMLKVRLEAERRTAHAAALAMGEAVAEAEAASREAQEQVLALHSRMVALTAIPAADDESMSPQDRVAAIAHNAAAAQHNADIEARIALVQPIADAAAAALAAVRRKSAAALRLVSDYDTALDDENLFSTRIAQATPEAQRYVKVGLAIHGDVYIFTARELAAHDGRILAEHERRANLAASVAAVESGTGFDPHLSEPRHSIEELSGDQR